MADYGVQRSNMVESQVRPADVTDRRIIRAMLEIPREAFAPDAAKPLAYMDAHLPVSVGGTRRFLLAPRILAKLIHALDVGENDAVLDVGCASGYSTAILSRLARRVVGVEPDAELAERARKTLATERVANATIVTGGVAAGAPDAGPFDAILINGSMARRPEELFDQMKDTGRIAAILADGPGGKAMLWRRRGTIVDGRPIFDAGAPAIAAFEKTAGFVF